MINLKNQAKIKEIFAKHISNALDEIIEEQISFDFFWGENNEERLAEFCFQNIMLLQEAEEERDANTED